MTSSMLQVLAVKTVLDLVKVVVGFGLTMFVVLDLSGDYCPVHVEEIQLEATTVATIRMLVLYAIQVSACNIIANITTFCVHIMCYSMH